MKPQIRLQPQFYSYLRGQLSNTLRVGYWARSQFWARLYNQVSPPFNDQLRHTLMSQLYNQLWNI